MTTWTALTTIESKPQAEALAEAAEALNPVPTGVGVFDVEDGSDVWEVGCYFTEKPDIAGLDLLAALHGARPFAVSKVPDRDWVAQVRRELTPVEAGRFVVYGSHDRARIGLQKTGLEIEAAMAFGTGHHGTTRGCLLSLDRLMRRGLAAPRVADIGCGTGVLGMAAQRAWRRTVIASDIDPQAVATARVNGRGNLIGTGLRVIPAAGFNAADLRRHAPFDLIFANILARPLLRMAPAMAAHSRPGTRIILSGLLTRQEAQVRNVYGGHQFVFEHRVILGEWSTLTLRRV